MARKVETHQLLNLQSGDKRSGLLGLAVSGRQAPEGPDAFLYTEMDAHTPWMRSGRLNHPAGGGKVQKVQAQSRAARWIPHV